MNKSNIEKKAGRQLLLRAGVRLDVYYCPMKKTLCFCGWRHSAVTRRVLDVVVDYLKEKNIPYSVSFRRPSITVQKEDWDR